jgi:hypothetical protein
VRVVITKKQAAAMADAAMAPAEARRQSANALKSRRQLAQHPVLAKLPEAERDAVLGEAAKYAARRWYLYLPALVLVAWTIVQIYGPPLLQIAPSNGAHLWPFAVAIGAILLMRGATFLLRRMAIRTYVLHAIEARSSGAVDHASPPSV